MIYRTAKQTAAEWKITERRVQDLCKQGAIAGATRHGREWLIPDFAVKPADGRKGGVKTTAVNHAGNEQFLRVLSVYNTPGTADRVLEQLANSPIERDFFLVHLLLYRGDSAAAKELLFKYYDENDQTAFRATVGMNLALCATCEGDIALWNKAMSYLQGGECADEQQRLVKNFWVAANASTVYDNTFFPDWFRRGDFTPLPKQTHAAARYFYVKYLYISAHESGKGESAIEFLRIMPLIIEPLITQTHVEGVMITEAYLRLMCAVAYHINGNDTLAAEHIERVLDIVLPDRLYMLLAEYRHRMSSLLDSILEQRDKAALAEVKRLSKRAQTNWIKLHNHVKKREVVDNLSTREQQIAKLAVYGLSNKEIADRLSITVNAVKQTLRSAMDKTGASSRQELYKYL